MGASALSAYFLTVLAVTAAPGPLVAVLAARTLARDRGGAVAFATGICFGDVLVVALICAGLGPWVQAKPELFDAAKWVGAAYLFWLATRMWRDARQPAASARQRRSLASAAAGLATCLSSPQTILLYLVLLPGVIEIERVDALAFGMLAAVTCAALAAVFAGVIVLAGRAQQLLASPGKSRACGRCMALTVAGTALWILMI